MLPISGRNTSRQNKTQILRRLRRKQRADGLQNLSVRPRLFLENMSSSSDDDNIVDSTLPGGLLTPQNDTPAEDKANTPEEEKLVVVPEAEVGMTAGKKHLYSKFINDDTTTITD